MYYKIINKKKKIGTLMADLFGQAMWSPFLLFRKRCDASFHQDLHRILVIRTAYVGDVVMTLPLLRPLKEMFPKARISFLTTSNAGEVLENNPFVDEILLYDAFWFYPNGKKKAIVDYLRILRVIRSRAYDLVIEARGDIRDIFLLAYLSGGKKRVSYGVGGGGFLLTHVVPFKSIKHKIRYHLDMATFLGCKADAVEWNMYLGKGEEHRAEEILESIGVTFERPLVAVHPGARKELKRWSSEGYALVADRLAKELDVSIVILGGPDEVKLAERVERLMRLEAFMLAGKTSLREMSAILKMCDLFICNDSAPLHIASMMRVPTVAVFGPSKREETGPYGNIHAVVEKEFECRYTCDEDVCHHIPYNACLKTIAPEDVFVPACDILMKRKAYGVSDTESSSE